MFDLINAGENPTYNGFVDAGVWRGAIPGGLRALEALGLIGVKRNSFRLERRRYDQNQYWTSDRWPQWEPSGPPKEAKKTAVNRAKAVAAAARRGSESEPLRGSDSGVRVRGSDSGTTSYEKVEGRLPTSQHSSRTTTVYEGWRRWSGVRDASPGDAPAAPDDGPGSPSGDGYGFDVPGISHSFNRVAVQSARRPPCGGLECGMEGECLHPASCRSAWP